MKWVGWVYTEEGVYWSRYLFNPLCSHTASLPTYYFTLFQVIVESAKVSQLFRLKLQRSAK